MDMKRRLASVRVGDGKAVGVEREKEEGKEEAKEESEAINDKDFAEAKKKDKAELHEIMDQEFEKMADKLKKLSSKDKLDEYWKTVSKIIEKSWMRHLAYDEDMVKRSRGRGEVKITTAIPKISTMKEGPKRLQNVAKSI